MQGPACLIDGYINALLIIFEQTAILKECYCLDSGLNLGSSFQKLMDIYFQSCYFNARELGFEV